MHARFETQGFRHGARHQTGIATHCFPLLSVLEQLMDGESATGRITAGDDDEQKLNQDLKWRHLAGLIGRHDVSTHEIVARGRAPASRSV